MASQSFPEDCLQYLASPWWTKTDSPRPARGRLVWVFVPHVDQHPMVLVPTGRENSRSHERAAFSVEPLTIRDPPRGSRLPVAGLPTYPGEVRALYRAKKRPALVLSPGGPDLPRNLRVGSARYQTNPTMLVAPYYGADQGGKTGGWKVDLVDRIRRCEYPQYLWDQLPLGGRKVSILRLDQIQPVGRHGESFELTEYCLGEDALRFVDEWLGWLFTGTLEEEGLLLEVRREFLGGS